MKTTKTIAVIILLAMVTLFTNCKKPKDGETGPVGPTGPAGTPNIVTTQFTVNTSDWALGCSNTCYSYSITAYVPTTVLNNGMVMGYFQNGNEWTPMPITINDYEFYFSYSLMAFNVRVRLASGATGITNPGQMVVKMVAIPPAMVRPHVDMANYNEVKNTYNLKD